MALAVDEREAVSHRALQFVYKVREIARHAQEIVKRIDADNLELVRLSGLQDSLWAQRTEISNWPYGSLTSLEVRQMLASEWPHVFTDAADVQTQTQIGSALFDTLATTIQDVLAASDAQRKRIDNDPVTGQRIFNKVPANESVQLRTDAAAVVSHMSGIIPD